MFPDALPASQPDLLPLMQHTAALIEQRTGLSTRAPRRDPAEIEALLVTQAGGDLPGMLARLRAAPLTDPLWQRLIRALAIGETYFFRDAGHFEVLRQRVLPALIQRRRAEGHLRLNLWSAGCATGEEPYSLAITLLELLPDLPQWDLHLLATDLNTGALDAAQRAVYRPWSFRQQNLAATDSDVRLTPYFDSTPDGMHLRERVAQMVTFRQGNLLNGVPLPPGGFDIIFCRHVLLYFTPEQVIAGEAVLRDALSPGGWLFLGPSETLRQGQHLWVTHLFPGVPIYQKAAHPDAVSRSRLPLPPPVAPGTGRRTTGSLLAALQAPSLPVKPNPAAPVVAVDEADTLYTAAVQAWHAEDRPTTDARLAALLMLNPTHARGWLLRAWLAADAGQADAAHAALDHALTLQPLLADGHYLRALLLQEDGQPGEAIHALRAALYCQRGHPLAAYLLGVLLAQSGDETRAIKLWEQARASIAPLAAEALLSDFTSVTAGRLLALLQASSG